MSTNTHTFSYTATGELIPPPLIAGKRPDELIAALLRAEDGLRSFQVSHRPILLEIATLHEHGIALRRVLSGDCYNDTERALYHAIMEDGQPLSLRPLNEAERTFASFIPAFRLLDAEDNRWQIGGDYGRKLNFVEENPASAVAFAQSVYLQWATEETRLGRTHGVR